MPWSCSHFYSDVGRCQENLCFWPIDCQGPDDAILLQVYCIKDHHGYPGCVWSLQDHSWKCGPTDLCLAMLWGPCGTGNQTCFRCPCPWPSLLHTPVINTLAEILVVRDNISRHSSSRESSVRALKRNINNLAACKLYPHSLKGNVK